MKSLLSTTLIAMLLLASACTQQDHYNTKTHVANLLPKDVYEVLPKTNTNIKLYKNTSDITGEYFELATIEYEEISTSRFKKNNSISALKQEVKKLGGNGILLLEESTNQKSREFTHTIKAKVIYALDQKFPANGPVAHLQ